VVGWTSGEPLALCSEEPQGVLYVGIVDLPEELTGGEGQKGSNKS